MATSVAFVGNTNNLEVNGLKSEIEGVFLNAAAVSVTIKDSNGAEVAGESWPQAMNYLPGSEGNYVLGLSRFVEFTSGAKYTAFIDADASDTESERFAHWQFPFTAQIRTK
jgi:hypothetical protein